VPCRRVPLFPWWHARALHLTPFRTSLSGELTFSPGETLLDSLRNSLAFRLGMDSLLTDHEDQSNGRTSVGLRFPGRDGRGHVANILSSDIVDSTRSFLRFYPNHTLRAEDCLLALVVADLLRALGRSPSRWRTTTALRIDLKGAAR
jgi:hypothetical protein